MPSTTAAATPRTSAKARTVAQAVDAACDRRAAERDAEQHRGEHGREAVERALHHDAEDLGPDDLVPDRDEARHREEEQEELGPRDDRGLAPSARLRRRLGDAQVAAEREDARADRQVDRAAASTLRASPSSGISQKPQA